MRWRVAGPAGILLAVAVTLGCDGLPGRPDPDQRPLPPTAVRDFGTLYGRHCAGCHGADGRLGAARPLADPLYLAWVDDASLRRVTAEGVPGSLMPGFARSAGGVLSDEQVGLLVEGLRSHWGGQPPSAALPPYAATRPGAPARGQDVFAARCAGCHGPDGRGGPHAGSVVDPAYLALVSDQALRSAVVAGRPDLGMPDFRGRGDQPALDDAEITDVVAWLAAQRPPAPTASAAGRAQTNGGRP
jgi:mono/diheme cytochrome c family protein